MKRFQITFSFFVLLLSTPLSIGQNLVQSRVANLVTGDYATSGTVYLETFDNNTIQVRFDNDYLTQSNVFDVHVYLTNNTNYSAPINVSNNYLIANIGTISGLNYSSGAMTFPISSSVSINDYDHIVLVCLSFGQLHWAHGDFTNYTIPTLPNYSESCQATPTAPILNVAGAPNIQGASNTPFPITNMGTTTIDWTFDDGAGNYATTTQDVVVTQLDVQISQVDNSLTAIQTPSGTSYQWIDCDNNNVPILGATSATFVAMQEGNYAVVADAGSCVDTSNCQSVSFDDIYDAPVLMDTAEYCEFTPATPSIALNNGTSLDGVPDVSFPITTLGTTTVTWTFTSSSGSTLTSQQAITIQALSSSVAQNGNVLNVSGAPQNSLYQWIDCENGNPIAGETGATFTATQEGSYALITTLGNCSDTSSCFDVSFASIDEMETELSAQLFPNPSNGNFTIVLGDITNDVSVQILDVSGRVVYEDDYTSVQGIPVSVDLKPANYIVLLKTAGSMETLRLVKQ
ncbi:MAG: T9SS type A sorting domain-containing protein [Crocinitomicaceae bacterium]